MKKKRAFNLEDAYSVRTPADSVRLYGDWADSYDTEFVTDAGYVSYLRVAELLLQNAEGIEGVVLDIGCGTGLIGTRLRRGGITSIDGIDISPEMLEKAAGKKTETNEPVYRRLITADLTKQLKLPDNHYAGLVSAGAFTSGHLGPEPLDELWRVAAPGAICAIGVKTSHYTAMKFEQKFARDADQGLITPPKLVEVQIYESHNHSEHAEDTALIVVCQVN